MSTPVVPPGAQKVSDLLGTAITCVVFTWPLGAGFVAALVLSDYWRQCWIATIVAEVLWLTYVAGIWGTRNT